VLGTEWCVVVLRDFHTKEDLVWEYVKKETALSYERLKRQLENLGYTVKGVTGDGFKGIRKAFTGITFQMCHVHMRRIIERATTRNPKTEIGIALLDLAQSLRYTNKETFTRMLFAFYKKHSASLEEFVIVPDTNTKRYARKELRSAYYSIMLFLPYLFGSSSSVVGKPRNMSYT
jgi:hypothetical protein